jgi:hypothetical protein
VAVEGIGTLEITRRTSRAFDAWTCAKSTQR